MVEYSVAVCNYNMADTLERSLRSMLEQLDDRFELVVVDGGSSDGSLEILSSLKTEYDSLRVEPLDPKDDRHLGADRNRSFEAARGAYVFESLDTDDVYYDGVIPDFAEIHRQLREQLDRSFYLAGKGINVAPRELLRSVQYRNLHGAEDRDFARRLFARNAIIWLAHDAVREEIGYHFDVMDTLRRDIAEKVCDFQCNLSFWSCIRWSLFGQRYGIYSSPRSGLGRVLRTCYDLSTYPYAYAKAQFRPSYETPTEFRRKGALAETIYRERKTLSEIEDIYDVTIDRDALSPAGRERFDIDRPPGERTE